MVIIVVVIHIFGWISVLTPCLQYHDGTGMFSPVLSFSSIVGAKYSCLKVEIEVHHLCSKL